MQWREMLRHLPVQPVKWSDVTLHRAQIPKYRVPLSNDLLS
jgi:hypothetical protein